MWARELEPAFLAMGSPRCEQEDPTVKAFSVSSSFLAGLGLLGLPGGFFL